MKNYSLISNAGLKKTAFTSFCMACLLLSLTTQAQVHTTSRLGVTTTTTTTTTVDPAILKAAMTPHASSFASFKNSRLYAQRQKFYRSTYNNPSKSFTMSDGTSMSISLIKNPSFINNATSVSPSLSAAAGGASGPSYYAIEPDQGWVDNNYNAQIHSTSVDFGATDYSFQVSHIFPGAIYTFDSYMDGSFQTPSPSTRNPITLGTDNPNSQNNFILVPHPAVNTIHNAIGLMAYHFPAVSNLVTSYKYFESNNMADWSLKVNAGGSNSGSSLINNDFFNTTDRRHHRYITIDVTKKLFNVFTNPPDNGFYSSSNSAEGTPNLVVIGSVNYGIRLLVTMELTFPNAEESQDFQNHLGLLQYSDNFDINYLQNHSYEITKITGYELGGNHAGNVSINQNGIQSSINNILNSVTAQNAYPISYRLYDMAWDVIGSSASTGMFRYVTSTPNPILLSATVSINCGSDGKNKETHYYYSMSPVNGQVVASYANTAENSEWKNNTSYHANGLNVSQNQSISEFANGTCNFRMVIAKPGTEPANFFQDMITSSASGLSQDIITTMKNLVGVFSKDDIHPFSLTLTLSFNKPGQVGNSNYNITWNNQSISTRDNPMIDLQFKYANGTFISQ